PEFQSDPGVMSLLNFKTSAGNLVPLDTVAKLTQASGPQSISHFGQLPAVTVSFGLDPDAALGDVLNRVKDAAAAAVPEGVAGEFEGSAKAFEGSVGNLALLLVIAILVVYIVLGILYESYVHPITILSGLPSAGVGALLT